MRPIPKNHATLEHGLVSAAHFQIAADEPEKQQNDDNRDVAVCHGIPELRMVFEGIRKANKRRSNTDNDFRTCGVTCEQHAYCVAYKVRKVII